MRLKLISCEVLHQEICAVVARACNQVDIEFLPVGMRELSAALMRQELQEVVDRADTAGYDAILMGYGLCGNSLVGLTARTLPLVVPRDVTSLRASPGLYFTTTGWIRTSQSRPGNVDLSHEQMVAKYGADNARFLEEDAVRYTKQYRQYTFIETARGDFSQFETLVNGPWEDGRYLVVAPGWRVAGGDGDGVLAAERAA